MNYRFIILCCFSIFLVACGGESAPAKVAKSYLKAVETGNFDAARGYVTAESQASIDKMVAKADMATEKAKYPATVELDKVNCEVKMETATCRLCCDAEGLSFEPIRLVKEEELWKVSLQPEER